MAVPSSNSQLVNTTGGAFTFAVEGGCILQNSAVTSGLGAVITKAQKAEAAKKAGYKNPVVIGRYMREGNKYSHVRREYERLMSEAKKKFELTHEKAVEDLYKLRDDAWSRGAFNAAIQAQGLLLKVGGLIVDRREVLHGKIDQMSREEVERRLQDLLGSKSGITIENKSETKAIESK